MTRHDTLRDRCWLWGQAPNSHYRWLQQESRITPWEAARELHIPNMMLVVMGDQPAPAEFPAWQAEVDDLPRVIWSVMGDASTTRNNAESDMATVLALAAKHPNIVGAIMDDLFIFPDFMQEPGRVARWTAEQIARTRAQLHAAGRALDLYSVFYSDLLLAKPDYIDQAVQHLTACDKVTLWTWESQHLPRLEEHFARLEALTGPSIGKLLGLYMWNYAGEGAGPMSVDTMEWQCELARAWLHEGRIEGMIFLGSPNCDLGLAAVDWSRAWIERVGDEVVQAR